MEGFQEDFYKGKMDIDTSQLPNVRAMLIGAPLGVRTDGERVNTVERQNIKSEDFTKTGKVQNSRFQSIRNRFVALSEGGTFKESSSNTQVEVSSYSEKSHSHSKIGSISDRNLYPPRVSIVNDNAHPWNKHSALSGDNAPNLTKVSSPWNNVQRLTKVSSSSENTQYTTSKVVPPRSNNNNTKYLGRKSPIMVSSDDDQSVRKVNLSSDSTPSLTKVGLSSNAGQPQTKPVPMKDNTKPLVQCAGPREDIISQNRSQKTIHINTSHGRIAVSSDGSPIPVHISTHPTSPTVPTDTQPLIEPAKNSVSMPTVSKATSVSVPINTYAKSFSVPFGSQENPVSVLVSTQESPVPAQNGSQGNSVSIPISPHGNTTPGSKKLSVPLGSQTSVFSVPIGNQGNSLSVSISSQPAKVSRRENGVLLPAASSSGEIETSWDPASKEIKIHSKTNKSPQDVKMTPELNTLDFPGQKDKENKELLLELSLPRSTSAHTVGGNQEKPKVVCSSHTQNVVSISTNGTKTVTKELSESTSGCSLKLGNFGDKFREKISQSQKMFSLSKILDTPEDLEDSFSEEANGEDKPYIQSSSTSFLINNPRGEFRERFQIFPPPLAFQDTPKTGSGLLSSHHFRLFPSFSRRAPSRLETVPESLVIDLTATTPSQDGGQEGRMDAKLSEGSPPTQRSAQNTVTSPGDITQAEKIKSNLYTSEINFHLGSDAPIEHFLNRHSENDQTVVKASPGLEQEEETLTNHHSDDVTKETTPTISTEVSSSEQEYIDEQPRRLNKKRSKFLDINLGSDPERLDNADPGEHPSHASSTPQPPSTHPLHQLTQSSQDPTAHSGQNSTTGSNSSLNNTSSIEDTQNGQSALLSTISDIGFRTWTQNEQSRKDNLNGNYLLNKEDSAIPYMDKLKVMTDRLKLSTRRPSVMAWRENVQNKPQGPWSKPGGEDGEKVVGLNDFSEVQDDGENGEWSEERKNRVEDALEWLQRELIYMRVQDQTLARTLITLRHEIQQVKLARSYAEHQETIEDAADELATERHLSEHSDTPPEHIPTALKQCGVTKMNINSRRFSVF